MACPPPSGWVKPTMSESWLEHRVRHTWLSQLPVPRQVDPPGNGTSDAPGNERGVERERRR